MAVRPSVQWIATACQGFGAQRDVASCRKRESREKAKQDIFRSVRGAAPVLLSALGGKRLQRKRSLRPFIPPSLPRPCSALCGTCAPFQYSSFPSWHWIKRRLDLPNLGSFFCLYVQFAKVENCLVYYLFQETFYFFSFLTFAFILNISRTFAQHVRYSGCALQESISSSHFICMDNKLVPLGFYFFCHPFSTPTMCRTSVKKEDGEFLIRFSSFTSERKLCSNTYTIQIYAKVGKNEVSGVQTFLNSELGCVSIPLPHIFLTDPSAARRILHLPVGNSNQNLPSNHLILRC